jgi:hypothetical protein
LAPLSKLTWGNDKIEIYRLLNIIYGSRHVYDEKKLMTFQDISIDSPIEEKIRWADRCYRVQKDLLLGDDKIDELLSKFKKAACLSHEYMAEAGFENACRNCEEREGGSCCGAGMENRYSGVLILINLLLEQKLPPKRQDPKSCFFLQESGCSLLARHVICVNYLCQKITERIDPEKISILRDKEGTELDILFLLNERVKAILNKDVTQKKIQSYLKTFGFNQ